MRRRPRLLTIVLALGTALAAGCATVPVNDVLPADEEYARARAAYEKEDFSVAAQHLSRLVLNYPDDPRVAEARFLLGMANYRNEEYPSAAQDFERFQTDFPADSLADDALYWAGRAYEEQALKPQLDQADTRRAVSSYESLVERYPASPLVEEVAERRDALRERLAEKEYLNARYYFRQELWEATEIYARSLIEEFPQSSWVAAAYLMLVRAYEGQGKEEDARRVREALLEQFPDSPEAGEARQARAPPAGVSLQVGNAR